MLCLFLASFAIIGEQFFGANLYFFSTPLEATTTLVQMLLGVVDLYWDMVAAKMGFERYIAIGYFILYIVFMFFIVINIFLAILNDAYAGEIHLSNRHMTVT